jgi:hypothetical protein
MDLTIGDKKVIQAFLDKQVDNSKHFTSTGQRLDGNWFGGMGIAQWDGNKIDMPMPSGRLIQGIQRVIRELASPRLLKDEDRMPPKRRNNPALDLSPPRGRYWPDQRNPSARVTALRHNPSGDASAKRHSRKRKSVETDGKPFFSDLGLGMSDFVANSFARKMKEIQRGKGAMTPSDLLKEISDTVGGLGVADFYDDGGPKLTTERTPGSELVASYIDFGMPAAATLLYNYGPSAFQFTSPEAWSTHWENKRTPYVPESSWQSLGRRRLEQLSQMEYETQLATHRKRGRAASTFRYDVPELLTRAADALSRDDEETFKGILMHEIWPVYFEKRRSTGMTAKGRRAPRRRNPEEGAVLGHIGDVDYEMYGGGIIVDTEWGPVLKYWVGQENGGGTHEIELSETPEEFESRFNWVDKDNIMSFIDIDDEDYEEMLSSLQGRAQLVVDFAHYYGWDQVENS